MNICMAIGVSLFLSIVAYVLVSVAFNEYVSMVFTIMKKSIINVIVFVAVFTESSHFVGVGK